MKELCLLTCPLALSPAYSPVQAQLSSSIAQVHPPRDGTAHRGLGPPTSVISKTISYRHSHRQSDQGNFSTENPPSHVIPGCVRLTIKNKLTDYKNSTGLLARLR